MPGVAQQEARVAAVSATVPVISQVGTCTHTLVQDGHCVTCALEVENSTEQTLDQQQVAVSASGTARQEVTVAATSAVFPGVSLVGTTTHALMQDGYWVTCAIEVENWTCFHLTDPHVQLKGGVLTVAPSVIVPAAREVMVSLGFMILTATFCFSCSISVLSLSLFLSSSFAFTCTYSSSSWFEFVAVVFIIAVVFHLCPNITIMVDWVLKISHLSIFFLIFGDYHFIITVISVLCNVFMFSSSCIIPERIFCSSAALNGSRDLLA